MPNQEPIRTHRKVVRLLRAQGLIELRKRSAKIDDSPRTFEKRRAGKEKS